MKTPWGDTNDTETVGLGLRFFYADERKNNGLSKGSYGLAVTAPIAKRLPDEVRALGVYSDEDVKPIKNIEGDYFFLGDLWQLVALAMPDCSDAFKIDTWADFVCEVVAVAVRNNAQKAYIAACRVSAISEQVAQSNLAEYIKIEKRYKDCADGFWRATFGVGMAGLYPLSFSAKERLDAIAETEKEGLRQEIERIRAKKSARKS